MSTNAELAEQIALRVFLRSLAEPLTVGMVRDCARAVLDDEPAESVIIGNERVDLTPRRRL